MLRVSWEIQYQLCDWTLRIATANYTLHPNPFPATVPIAKNSEYNVTLNIMCNGEGPGKVVNMNVSLSILLNDNVIKHVPYILCSLSRLDTNDNTIHYHRSRKVYLQSYLYHEIMTSSTALTQDSTSFTQEMQSLYHLTSNQAILSTRNEGITSSANNIMMISHEGFFTYYGALFCLITLLCHPI